MLNRENRLYFAMIGAPTVPVGLFWMAWTSFASISYWSSLVASTFVGAAFLGTFISSYLYTFDAFEGSVASGLAVVAFVRYIAAGVMVPVSIPMYESLGVHWSLTLLGCVSTILTPVPFVMWKFGHAIRKRSRVGRAKALAEEQRAAPANEDPEKNACKAVLEPKEMRPTRANTTDKAIVAFMGVLVTEFTVLNHFPNGNAPSRA